MIIRRITAVVACVASVAFAGDAAAQDTSRTGDTMQMRMQMQRQGAMMTMQARDSMIAQLLDSANRTQDPTMAQRLRDSVTTLRSAATSTDSMSNRLTSPQQQTMQQNMQRQNTQQQNMQQQNTQQQSMQQREPSAVTSDQRVRMQKDGRSYPDNGSTVNPPESGA